MACKVLFDSGDYCGLNALAQADSSHKSAEGWSNWLELIHIAAPLI